MAFGIPAAQPALRGAANEGFGIEFALNIGVNFVAQWGQMHNSAVRKRWRDMTSVDVHRAGAHHLPPHRPHFAIDQRLFVNIFKLGGGGRRDAVGADARKCAFHIKRRRDRRHHCDILNE